MTTVKRPAKVKPRRIVVGSGGLSLAARASLKLWLRADRGTPETGSWQDQSGTGNHAAATGTPRVMVGQAGQKAVLISAGSYFQGTTNVVPSGSPRTAVLVFRNHQTGDFPFTFRRGSPAFGCSWKWFGDADKTIQVYSSINTQYAAIRGGALNHGGAFVYEMTWDGVTSHFVSLTLNGVEQAVVPLFSGTGVEPDTGTSGYGVGGTGGGLWSGWSGEVSEVAIFDSVLSNADRSLIRSAYSDRYRIPLA